MGKTLLEMQGIIKNFPGVNALKNVNFFVEEGVIHALIGENGAGKSTLMNILIGNYKPDSGTISINGQKCNIHSPDEAGALGISMVPQEITLVPNLTIAENLFLGNESKNRFGIIDWKKTEQRSIDLLSALGITINVQDKVEDLSVAYKQIIQIARALSKNPKILILDEPTASLTGKEIDILFSIIRKLKHEGKSVIFISHRLEELKAVTNKMTIMRDGQVVYEDFTNNLPIEKIIEYMANREAKILVREARNIKAEVILSVQNLSCKNLFHNITFDVFKGEILGIGGLVGSKRTELISAIFGLIKPDSGTVFFKGNYLKASKSWKTIAMGMGFLPEERRRDGIFPYLNIAENISITLYDKIKNFWGINYSAIRSISSDFVEKLRIKTPSINAQIKNLSGGNQQKVILARWLARKTDFLILDEPTKGIDVNAKFEIYQLIKKFADDGLTVLIISSEHKELLALCDRIMVMHEGICKGFLNAASATEEDILKKALMEVI